MLVPSPLLDSTCTDNSKNNGPTATAEKGQVKDAVVRKKERKAHHARAQEDREPACEVSGSEGGEGNASNNSNPSDTSNLFNVTMSILQLPRPPFSPMASTTDLTDPHHSQQPCESLRGTFLHYDQPQQQQQQQQQQQEQEQEQQKNCEKIKSDQNEDRQLCLKRLPPPASVSYRVLKATFSLALTSFFREIRPRGSHHVPATGPVLLVAAPHHNQFIDPLILMHTCPRPVYFLTAQKSMNRPVIGPLARAIGSIPVARACDYARKPALIPASMIPLTNFNTAKQVSSMEPPENERAVPTLQKHVLMQLRQRNKHKSKRRHSSRSLRHLQDQCSSTFSLSNIELDKKEKVPRLYEKEPGLFESRLCIIDPVDAPHVLSFVPCCVPPGLQLNEGDLVYLTHPCDEGPYTIAETIGLANSTGKPSLNPRIVLTRPISDENTVTRLSHPDGVVWRYLPAKDRPKNAPLYQRVHESLSKHECIGIFPEGGSHDRPELLPFKAGFALMALGAMAADPTLDVKIVPVGLSYFHPHRFRSRAVVEYGTPISVPSQILKAYVHGSPDDRRHACCALLNVVSAAVANVSVSTPDMRTLLVAQAVRRLYRPLNRKLTLIQRLEVTRSLVRGPLLKQNEHPRLRNLERLVLRYNGLLALHGLQDHQVEAISYSAIRAFAMLVVRLLALLLAAILVSPGTILNFPVMCAASLISKRKAKEALAASTVKIAGRDVLATWKLLVGFVMLPVTYCVYVALSWFFIVPYFDRRYRFFIPLVTMIGVPLISRFAIIVGDKLADLYKSIKPLLYALMPTRSVHSFNLSNARVELTNEINAIISELAPSEFPDLQEYFLADAEANAQKKGTRNGFKLISSWVSSWLIKAVGESNEASLVFDNIESGNTSTAQGSYASTDTSDSDLVSKGSPEKKQYKDDYSEKIRGQVRDQQQLSVLGKKDNVQMSSPQSTNSNFTFLRESMVSPVPVDMTKYFVAPTSSSTSPTTQLTIPSETPVSKKTAEEVEQK